ncbi:MAG TPA: FAD-dependent oxidoreductase, partial [Bacteroidales bacterium]|nr:FAD-dependent oxidoreductase [Bacteroidales bacterium]
RLSQGYELFNAHLLEHFPGERKAIEHYIGRIIGVTKDFPLYDIATASSYKIRPEVLGECAFTFLDSLSGNERLKNVLGGALSLYAGNPDKTPLYIHALMRDSLVKSCWRPVDGSQQIADRLVEGILENGGTVLTSHKVSEIIIENEKASAVMVDNGSRFNADVFISNAHPATTLSLIGEGKIRKIYRKRIMALENSWGVFTLYAVLRKNSFPYLNKNYFHYNGQGILHARHDEAHWPDNYYFYTPAVKNTPEFAESIVVMADMKYDEVRKWQGTGINRRGEEYADFKQARAERLLSALERRLPGIREKILKYYTSTPLTFFDYTGTHEGSAYGIMKDCRDPQRSIIQTRSKISNLYFTGQNLNLHGILGVTAAAVITCSEIVGLEYLSRKIADGQ